MATAVDGRQGLLPEAKVNDMSCIQAAERRWTLSNISLPAKCKDEEGVLWSVSCPTRRQDTRSFRISEQ